MPFKSEQQRRFMWANHPEIAKRWTSKYGSIAQDMLNKKKQKKVVNDKKS